MNAAARVVLILVGVIAIVVGGVWFGQGIGWIPGSYMTGDRTWLYVGLLVVVAGIVVIAVALRRRKRTAR